MYVGAVFIGGIAAITNAIIDPRTGYIQWSVAGICAMENAVRTCARAGLIASIAAITEIIIDFDVVDLSPTIQTRKCL